MKKLFARLKTAALTLLGRSTAAAPVPASVLENELPHPFVGSAEDAQQTVARLIADYKDEVCWDEVCGAVVINSTESLPYSKEYNFDLPIYDAYAPANVADENAAPAEAAPEVPAPTKPKRPRRAKAKPETPAAEAPAPAKKPRKKKD